MIRAAGQDQEGTVNEIYGGRWQVVAEEGKGGQADVYRVRDTVSDANYALKRLRDDGPVGRLANELEALQQIEHPNVVRVVDHHVEGDPPYYLVMELLEGGTLEERVEEYKGDIVRSLELFCAICDGILAAHELKPPVIHRDLKPGNVLFRSRDDATPIVTDFGLCWIDDRARFTATQERVGAFRYMAPELEDGRLDRPTARCDVYSLGKLLYYIITGGVEFNREKHREPEYDLYRRFSVDSADPLRDAQLEYISRLLDHMITLDPDERYGKALQVRTLARNVGSLVKNGHYPFTDNMPCKFCGKGLYDRQSPTDFPVLFGGVMPPSLDDFPVAIFRCTHCGHLQLFDFHTFEKHDPRRAQG